MQQYQQQKGATDTRPFHLACGRAWMRWCDGGGKGKSHFEVEERIEEDFFLSSIKIST